MILKYFKYWDINRNETFQIQDTLE
jgi:hypothetical protein